MAELIPYSIQPPNDGLITETNQIYYAGAQNIYVEANDSTKIELGFESDLIYYTNNTSNINYGLNNFKVLLSIDGGFTFTEYITQNGFGEITKSDLQKNILTFPNALPQFSYVRIKLNETTKQENFGGYAYTKLNDIVNNFMVAYVGQGKLIADVKRTDVIFHTKRAMQEFSFDTLKSIKSQELNIPPSLSVILPQDYVNHVRCSWIDNLGVQHIIYPVNNLTSNPYTIPLQDDKGVPTNDNFGTNLKGTSLVEKRWDEANDRKITGVFNNYDDPEQYGWYGYDWGWGGFYGKRYGLNPETTQVNGWYNINDREGKMSFSSDLGGRLIVLEYISDGLAYDLDTKVPKMAEGAMYSYLNHAILSTRISTPEYIVQRYKREASAKLRNTKIRLSNLKLDEFVAVMRNKSKQIKS
tara:strand:+ start:7897 stop:9132 length:1236 start_codon:yes stop_codon:yes gene_type:complete